MNRDFDYRRHQEERHIEKKLSIIKHVYWLPVGFLPTNVKEPHRLAKQKVHCSCHICRRKTNAHTGSYLQKDSRRLKKQWPVRDARHLKTEEEL